MADDTTMATRDDGLDRARGLGIILVIVAHALEAMFLARPDGGFFHPAFAIWQAIYAFHMPLFFLLSGAANRDLAARPGREVLRGSLRLILLAWICQIAGAVLGVVLGRVPAEPRAVAEAVLRPIVVGYDWSTAVVWFLVSLAVVRLVVHGLAARTSRPATVTAVFALALGLWALADPSVPDIQQVRTWAVGCLFFALGRRLATGSSRLPAAPVGAAMLAVAVALAPFNLGCTWSPLDVCPVAVLDGRAAVVMVGGFYGNLPMFLVTALLGAVGAWSLAARLGGARLAGLGRMSLDLFLLNGFVLVFTGPIAKALPIDGIGPLALHLALVVLAVPVHVVLARRFRGVLKTAMRSAEGAADTVIPRNAAVPAG